MQIRIGGAYLSAGSVPESTAHHQHGHQAAARKRNVREPKRALCHVTARRDRSLTTARHMGTFRGMADDAMNTCASKILNSTARGKAPILKLVQCETQAW